jgi:hypothetical protein
MPSHIFRNKRPYFISGLSWDNQGHIVLICKMLHNLASGHAMKAF